MYLKIKPNFQSEFVYNAIWTLIIGGTITAILATLSIIWVNFPTIILTILALITTIFLILNSYIRYQKTEYEITDEKIITKTGGIFTNYQTELQYKNVTHITQIRPYLKYKFFKTEHIFIESSGSATVSSPLFGIDSSYNMYENIIEILKNHNFAISGKTVSEYIPEHRGIILESFTKLVSVIATGIFLLIIYGTELILLQSELHQTSKITIALISVGLTILCAVFIGNSILSYLDKKMQRYELHTDHFVYYNGFLTTQKTLLPVQNIANTATKQSLLQRIFQIGNITLSVQGSGSEIYFTNLAQTKQVQQAIETIIAAHKQKPINQTKEAKIMQKKASKVTKNVDTDSLDTLVTKLDEENIAQTIKNPKITHSFKIHRPKLIIQLVLQIIMYTILSIALFFIQPILALFSAFAFFGNVYNTASKFRTTYYITTNGISQEVDFFKKETIEYTYEKIMSVQRTKTILDTLFQTHSLEIKSIGTNKKLVLESIHNSIDTEKIVFEQLDIPQLVSTKRTPITFLRSIWANLGGILTITVIAIMTSLALSIYYIVAKEPYILLIITAILSIMLPIIILLVFHTYFVYKNASIEFTKKHITYASGYWRRKRVTTKFENIKIVNFSINKFVDFEHITLQIAGEELIEKSDKNQTIIPNIIHIYANTDSLNDLLKETKIPDQLLMEKKPSLKKAAFFTIITGIFIIPLFISIPHMLWLRTHTYYIHKQKIVLQYGLLANKTKILAAQKIDYIAKAQGPIDKLCNVTSINIFTPGTSLVDFTIGPITESEDVFETITNIYGTKVKKAKE
jgi:membrane protein YdbS with pleckstrin-like domain